EARARIVLIFARPGAQQVVVERRTARRTAVGRRPFQRLHDVRNGLQLPFDDGVANVLVAVFGALAYRLGPRLGLEGVAQRALQQAFDDTGTRAARGRSLAV